jgi:hypothetical protein
MPDRLRTNTNDHLRLKVIKGAGRLVLPLEGEYRIDETTNAELPKVNGSRSFHLINPHNELLVVHASSTFDPTNPTDINHPGDHEIDDSWLLPTDLTYAHSQTFGPNGTVELRLI